MEVRLSRLGAAAGYACNLLAPDAEIQKCAAEGFVRRSAFPWK